MRKIISVIPAQPGWSHLSRLINEENRVEKFVHIPIIGWAFGYDDEEAEEKGFVSCYPLSVEAGHIRSDENRFGLMRSPDGQVIEPFVGSWDSEMDALAAIQEEDSEQKKIGFLRPQHG
jgi:hypothetical protein